MSEPLVNTTAVVRIVIQFEAGDFPEDLTAREIYERASREASQKTANLLRSLEPDYGLKVVGSPVLELVSSRRARGDG